MIVTVNGQPRELDPGATVATVVGLLDVGLGGRGVAVALDGEVIARSRWEQASLYDGALIEIVAAVAGG